MSTERQHRLFDMERCKAWAAPLMGRWRGRDDEADVDREGGEERVQE